ncbi:uncharacterized protein LOC127750088 [Frankliniella occidentalis]|uniref:Uncharacterized protein LOC127750088 n=1 Tax=Frankliniella occidentalis TaxID=133901 RepID=A0A9C6X0T0_FRAOC|nr:uncharacterized protein LOC127750088 [Frankliniella occidentalis]
MIKIERETFLDIMTRQDILMVVPSRIQPRPYKNKPRASWDICRITSLPTFINTRGEAGFSLVQPDTVGLRRPLGSSKNCPLPTCNASVPPEKGIVNHVMVHKNKKLLQVAHAIQANARTIPQDLADDLPLAPSAGILILLNLAGFVRFTDEWALQLY